MKMFGISENINNFETQSTFKMKSKTYIQDLSEIRQMMERSSRFISLSGLSGILVGSYALAGAFVAFILLKRPIVTAYTDHDTGTIIWLFVTAVTVLALAIGTGIIPTIRRTKKMNIKAWDRTSRRLALNLAIPLIAGGIFILLIIVKGFAVLVAPLMLIFYGLALINASKYTLNDIRYLGISEVFLGLLATWYHGYGLFFWAIGFGVLHIVYGSVMFYKYEK
jgi:hypothetical protein